MTLVLVVEDDPVVGDVVRRYLEQDGLLVQFRSDGPTALAAARQAPPDLVVLDLGLPGMDGLEVFRRLQQPAQFPVITLTARGKQDDRLLGLGVGAEGSLLGVLVRPLLEPMALLLRDGDALGRYSSRSEAVMATALAAASAGWAEIAWRDVLHGSALSDWASLQRRKGGGLLQRNAPDVEHRLATTWRAAARRAAERPPVGDAPSVRAELAALLAAADHNPGLWAGAAGVTDRAVLAALVDVAVAACTVTPSASTRQLSEAANISHSTAAVSLERLRKRGWLRLEQSAAGTLATTWRLVRPEHVQEPPARVEEVLDALPPRSVTLPAAAPARTTRSPTRCTGAWGGWLPACSMPWTTAPTAAFPCASSPRSPGCTPAPSCGT